MSPGRILALYRFAFAALIIVASLQALVAGHEGAHQIVPLASAEIAGALLLSWRRTQEAGACLLLGVLIWAQALSVLDGKWPTHFLQYAASTILIVALERSMRTSARSAQ
jgi:hypothetical protein